MHQVLASKLLSFGCGAAQYGRHVEERVAPIFTREYIPEDDGNRFLRNASTYPPTARGNTTSVFYGEKTVNCSKIFNFVEHPLSTLG
jgi:hypothetical protein